MNLHIELGKRKTDGSCKAYILIGGGKDKNRIPTNIVFTNGDYKSTKGGIKILNAQSDK